MNQALSYNFVNPVKNSRVKLSQIDYPTKSVEYKTSNIFDAGSEIF